MLNLWALTRIKLLATRRLPQHHFQPNQPARTLPPEKRLPSETMRAAVRFWGFWVCWAVEMPIPDPRCDRTERFPYTLFRLGNVAFAVLPLAVSKCISLRSRFGFSAPSRNTSESTCRTSCQGERLMTRLFTILRTQLPAFDIPCSLRVGVPNTTRYDLLPNMSSFIS